LEKIYAESLQSGEIGRGAETSEQAFATGTYFVTCTDADGQVKWEDTIKNLVVTAGKNYLLDSFLNTVSFTPTWYLGLIDGTSTPTYNAADTATSHAGWTESVAYSNATRPAPAWNAATGGTKNTSPTAFNINATVTIAGTFLISNTTKNGTTGILYSAGSFNSGNKQVASGDILNVIYQAQV
jgi:hypothetical protein